VIGVIAIVAAVAINAELTPSIVAAGGSVDQAWYVIETSPSTWSLHVGELSGHEPTMAKVRELTHAPAAIAGAGDRLWLLYGGLDGGAADLFSLQAIYNPVLESWYATPTSHLEAIPLPPALSQVLTLCGDDYGPVLVTSSADGPVVWGMAGQVWTVCDPLVWSGGDLDAAAHFWAGGGDILAGATSSGILEIRQWTSRTTPWQRRSVAAPQGKLHSIVVVDSVIVTISTEDGEIHVGVIQGDQVLPVASVERPETPWWVIAGSGAIAVTWMGDQGIPVVQRVTVPTGAVSTPKNVVTIESSASAMAVWQMAMVVVMALSIVVVMAMGRRVADLPPPEKTLILASPMVRLLALGIDLIPGAVTAYYAASLSPMTVLRGGLGVTTVDQAIELTVVIAVTVVWCFLWEATTGTTLGKWLLGMQVRSTSGTRPTLGSTAIRNAFKAIVLFVPPLAILVILNPRQQGLGDIASGTIVTKRG
jgi:uncharacterized RDD family membrane protein YckC